MKKFWLDSVRTVAPGDWPRPARPADGAAENPRADKPQREASGQAAAVCDACGEINQDDAAYCLECGEPLRGRGGS